MRVAELRIEGFGRLANLSLRFTPGLNLVYGPNEAGKSTLHEALLALLYGFPDDEAAAAFRPWDEARPCAGSLTYALDDGQAFRVARRFLPNPEVSLRTHPSGEDVSSRFKGAGRGRLPFAEAHWGLGLDVFEQVCVVRQGGLVPLRTPGPVVEILRQRLTGAPADATVARALDILEAGIKERIGAPHSRSRPLAQALAALARLEEERERALQLRRTLTPHLSDLRAAAQRLAELDARRAELLRRQAELREASIPPQAVAEVSAEVKRCEAEVARWQAWSAFPAHLRDSLLRLSAQHTRLREECTMAERRGRRAQEELAALEAQEASLRERLSALRPAERSPTADIARVQALASEWRMASELEWSANERWRTAQPSLEALEKRLAEEREEVQPALPAGLAGLALIQQRLKEARQRLAHAKAELAQATAAWARLGIEESEFKRLDRAVQTFSSATSAKPEPSRGRRWLASILGREDEDDQAPAGLASYRDAQPVYAEMARCRAEVDTAQRALSDVEATTLWQLGRLLGGTLDESAFDQLRERLERHLRAEAELEQQRITVAGLRSELDQVRERREKAQEALRAELARLGFTASDLHKALADYAHQSERKDQVAHDDADEERLRLRMEAELDLLHARAEAQRIPLEHWHEAQRALADVEAEISALLAQARIEGRMDALDVALRDFDEGVECYRRWERAKADLEAAVRYQRALLETEPFTKPGGGRVASPEAAEAEACAAELARIEEERVIAAKAHSRLEIEVQQSMIGVRHLAEIDEEIALAQAEVRRLESLQDALALARDELAQTAREFQQQFGPYLDSFMSDGMRQVTGGRYTSASVDQASLAVSLRVPELGAVVPAERLATSTRSLAHLFLRAGIARLVSRSGEKVPLLLDEPLAQCDQGQQERALDFLARLAEETQVVLLTKEEHLKARFEKALSSSPQNELHVLKVA